MKVHIEFDFKSVVGGGTNFLEKLRDKFVSNKILSSAEQADVILFNSHHSLSSVKSLMNKYPKKVFVHRVDGPMRLYNNNSDKRDDSVIEFSKMANGIVFQSEWSKIQNKNLYGSVFDGKESEIILNGCDLNERIVEKKEKIILISTSISTNINKGFDHYGYLDENLDFDKYEYWVLFNKQVKYKNIKNFGIKDNLQVLEFLKRADIYITASKNDPCSNSLIEAMSTGLPCIALDSGGHPEILNGSGKLFTSSIELINSIEEVTKNYDIYEKDMKPLIMQDVVNKYVSFFDRLLVINA